MEHVNTALAKLLKGLKKETGAKSIQQNYRGTGRNAHCRQLWVRWNNGAVLDIWLEADYVKLGGIVWIDPTGDRTVPGTNVVKHGETAEETYQAVKAALEPWLGKAAA